MRAPDIDAAALETLLAAATAAPSIHNTQPWRFRLDVATGILQVRAVPERALPRTDPNRCAQHLSVGAALYNLRVAARHQGRQPAVRLLPDPTDRDLLAEVALTGHGEEPDPWTRELYDAIGRRHSSRLPFTGRPVPEAIVSEMAEAVRSEGARLYVPGITGARRLLRATAIAELRNTREPARVAESRAWVARPGAAPYGVPACALGARDTAGRMPMRDFTGALPFPRVPALRFERHVQVALLWTRCDRPEDWLRAGQALQHALLVATVHGVRTSMFHQAMEWADLREAVREPDHGRSHPQLLIRFGYGPEGGRTPRA
ncbi:Acg family FMN-binding oxidoreductase [Streptomyces sp. NPDC008313]|uniref:Acg family FMN-binding oxidoreductase n=1 Tax=Streptomyces sp. NPDC008313 TaxID=3364826 RepID=UPI0036E6A263